MQQYEFKELWEAHIRSWWSSLVSQINDAKEKGKRPILIALSRKMPRFISWFRQIYNDPELEEGPRLLDEVELTTELAIPFIFDYSEVDNNNIEFLIIDDIIIHGTTLKSVANDLKFLTGYKPSVYCISRHKRAVIPDSVSNIEDVNQMPKLDQEKVDDFVDFNAEIVETYQLPIDLEFPIFITQSGNCENLWNNLVQDAISKEDEYVFGTEKNRLCKVYSFSLDNEYKCDFKKIRFYYKKPNDSIALAVFAPTVFPEYVLTSQDIRLFKNEAFQSIWDKTTTDIRRQIMEFSLNDSSGIRTNIKVNYIRSLCVWANYLLSLSFFIANKRKQDDSFGTEMNKFTLDKGNLALLIGKDMSDTVYDDLLRLIETGATSGVISGMNEGVAPNDFAPEAFKNRMEVEKGKILIDSHSPEEILEKIFQFQHYANPEFAHPQFAFERLFFGETYSSLEHALFPFYQNGENIMKMNEWIDRKIDEGCVVPKYERVLSSSGEILWRRYFHPGLKQIKR